MTDTSETMTPRDAARVMAEAARYEDALAERTGGITWMIWGLVTPGIFLSYALADAAGLPGGPQWGLLWAPWVAAGILATAALWRSAALAAPALRDENVAAMWVRWLGATALVTVAIFLMPATPLNEPLVVVGAFWFLMGALNLFRAPRRARLVAVAAGAAVLAGAALLAATGLGGTANDVAAAALSGTIPFAAGFYHTLRA